MAPVLQLLLLCSLGLLLLLLLLLPAGAQPTTIQELYVKPTEDTSCSEPCHTLDEYVQNATQYFVSNTAFNFLPGTHNLSKSLNVSGVTNLALVASNGTVNIFCPNDSYLSFSEISNLTLEDLTLSMCGTLFISELLNFSLLRVCVQPSVNLTPNNMEIMDATNILRTFMLVGFSIISVDTAHHGDASHFIEIQYTDPSNWTLGPLPLHNHLLIRDSIFNHSTSCYLEVVCHQSTYDVNVQVENLTATYRLGLVFYSQSDLSLVIMNLHLKIFSVLYVIANTASVDISNCHLSQTEVAFETSGQLTLKDSVINQGNGSLAVSSGVDCLILKISNVTFSDLQLQPRGYNRDQATTNSLVLLQDVNDVNLTDCKFLKNKATFGGTLGSVVLLDHSNNVSFTNCEFSGNVGSPITALESTFNLSGFNNFSNNRAYQGGALGFYGNSYVTLSNWSNTQFHNNSAVTVGGAIYVVTN